MAFSVVFEYNRDLLPVTIYDVGSLTQKSLSLFPLLIRLLETVVIFVTVFQHLSMPFYILCSDRRLLEREIKSLL